MTLCLPVYWRIPEIGKTCEEHRAIVQCKSSTCIHKQSRWSYLRIKKNWEDTRNVCACWSFSPPFPTLFLLCSLLWPNTHLSTRLRKHVWCSKLQRKTQQVFLCAIFCNQALHKYSPCSNASYLKISVQSNKNSGVIELCIEQLYRA